MNSYDTIVHWSASSKIGPFLSKKKNFDDKTHFPREESISEGNHHDTWVAGEKWALSTNLLRGPLKLNSVVELLCQVFNSNNQRVKCLPPPVRQAHVLKQFIIRPSVTSCSSNAAAGEGVDLLSVLVQYGNLLVSSGRGATAWVSAVSEHRPRENSYYTGTMNFSDSNVAGVVTYRRSFYLLHYLELESLFPVKFINLTPSSFRAKQQHRTDGILPENQRIRGNHPNNYG